jgi:hypothetical protein
MKRLLSLLLLISLISIITGSISFAQPAYLGTDAVNGSYSTYALTARGAVLYYSFQSSAGGTSRKWEFPSAGGNYYYVWRPYDNSGTDNVLSSFNTKIDPSVSTASARYNSNYGGATGAFTPTTGDYYTWIVGTNSSSSNYMSVLQTSYNPTTISSVAQSPSSPNSSQNVTVSVTLSNSLNSGEMLYVRYTTNGWSTSSFVQVTSFVGDVGTATIPAQSSGTAVQYYALTSVSASPGSDVDYYTLNLLNNGGSNYSYTVNSNWTSTQNGNWSNPATWVSNSVPSSTANVTIANNVTLDESATISSLTINNGSKFTAGDSLTINASGTFTNNGSFAGTGGTVSFAGAGTVTGTVGFYNLVINAGTLTLSGTVDTINGTFQINNGNISTNPPIYANGSTLLYNASYGVFNEWGAGTSGAGVPYNVTVAAGTLTMPIAARTANGTVTINNSCGLAFNGGNSLGVGGGVVNNGTLTLGTSAGGDLTLGGNFTMNSGAVLTNNGRAINFTGSSAQTIGGTIANITFAYLTINNSAGVSLNLPIIVGNQLNLNGGSLSLGANTATISSGGAISFGGGSIGSAGTVAFAGSGSVIGSAGTFGNTVTIAGGVDFNSSTNTATIGSGGTLQINSGGFIANSHPPIYNAASTLVYSAGGTYSRNTEWSATSGAGYPGNVTVQNNTTLDMGANSGTGVARQCAGLLSIASSSTLTMNNSGDAMTAAVTTTGGVTINGALTLSASGGGFYVSGGNWTLGSGGTFTNNNATTTFNGSSGQSITGATTFGGLTVNNGSGITINNNIAVSNTLTFTSGTITTGSDTVTLGSSGSVSRTSGYVVGNFRQTIPTGAATPTFEIGSASAYTPVSLAFHNVSASGTLTASTTTGQHPNIGTSGINSSKDINRYYTISNSGTTFDSCSVTFNFAASDTAVGSCTSNYAVGKYDSPNWTYPEVGTRTSTSTQATGITSFSDFAIGDLQTFTITPSAGSNGSISPSTPQTVNYGSSQTLTFTPNTNYHTDSLYIDGVGQSANSQASYTFTNVTANHTIRVTFALTGYTITASAGSNGSISPSGSVGVNSGANQTFTLSPNTEYHTDSVYVDGVGSKDSGATSYTFTSVTANHTFSVTFKINCYTLTPSVGPNGNGTISPSTVQMVKYDSSQIFTFTPAPGYHTDSLYTDGIGIRDSGATADTLKSISANHTIEVTFAINTYTLTPSAGAHGSISPSTAQTVNYNGSQSFTLTPNSGFAVDSVSIDGVGSAYTSSSYTFTNVTANHTISVAFGALPDTITASAGANGTISPLGTVLVTPGNSQSFTIAANSGYHIVEVLVDGSPVGAVTSYSFTGVSANHTISASFGANTGVTIDGVIGSGEYGNQTDGNNQQNSNGTTWYMTWDSTALYVGITGANITEGAVMYLDLSPLTPINSGTNSNGTIVGQAYDNTNLASLQFRAGVVVYFHNGYREYRKANGSGGWGNAVTTFGTYADNSGTRTRELAIPWSDISLSLPSSFAWFGYVTSSAGYVYGPEPIENDAASIGTSAQLHRYFVVNSTFGGSTVLPFSRDSYVFNQSSDATNFGSINVWDFTMNTSGNTITRASGAGGAWTIGGNLNINAGTVDFGSSTTAASVAGCVMIGASGTLKLSTASGGDLNLTGNFTNNGTFTANSRAVGFDGSSAQTATGATSFDYLTINNSAGVTLNSATTVTTQLTLTNGALANGSNLTLGNGATISRAIGTLSSAPNFGTSVNLVYTGSTAVNDDNELPSANLINNLTVDNTGGVTFTNSQATALRSKLKKLEGGSGTITVQSTLSIGSGALVNDGGNTLAVNGSVSNSGTASGTGEILLTGGSASHTLSGGGTFGNLELNDVNGASLSGNATVTGVLTLTTGMFTVGANTLTIENPLGGTATDLSAGSTSSLTIAGSASGITIPSSITQLNGLALNNSSGLTQSSTLSLSSLTLTSGTLTFSPGVKDTIRSGGSISATSGSLASGTGGGTFVFSGTGTISGTLAFNNVAISGGVDFGTGSTVDGCLTIDAGGYVSIVHPPTYGSSSLLKYNTGGIYGRADEWNSTSGAGYPNNVRISGSTTLDLGNNGTATARQTAGNLIVDTGSVLTLNNSPNQMTQPLTVGGNVLNNGTITLSSLAGGDLNLKGNWTNNGTLTTNSRAVGFIGSTAQSVTGATTFDYLSLNNSAGMTLNNNITANQTLTLTSGNIITGSNKVVIGSTGSVSRTSGYIQGNLDKSVGTGTVSKTFEIGDVTTYAPVNLNIYSITTGGDITASTTPGSHPNISTSGLQTTKLVNRYWTITNNNTAFSTYDATFNFASGDVAAGSDTSKFEVRKYDAPNWTIPTQGNHSTTSTQATGMIGFSDFAIGDPVKDTITASAGSNGSINPSGTVTVDQGGSQSFTISANGGYYIDSVDVDGTNVTSNHTISAYFSSNPPGTHVITASAGSNGTVSPSGNVDVTNGSTQIFTITPATGYHVATLTVDGGSVTPATSDTFTNVTANHTIAVTFAINTYTITASSDTNGTISPSGAVSVNYGGTQSFTIAPHTGYSIDSLIVDNVPVSVSSSYSFSNVTANHTIRVVFSAITFTLTSSAGPGGTISPLGTVTVNYGSSRTFAVTPDTDYHVVSVFLDTVSVAIQPSYTFSNIIANHSISATFAVDSGVVVDGYIRPNEYGVQVDGQNQQSNSGVIWYMTWDTTNLYVAVSGGSVSDGAVLYLDKAPVAPINGGTNSTGTNVGQLYDGVNFTSLQFRANFVTYFKHGYREYRQANGSNGWGSNTTSFGNYADNTTTNVREMSIPWSAITGGGKPASFAWFGYVANSSGSVYAQVPIENGFGTIGTSAQFGRYYIVNCTALDSASVKPFSRDSYVFNQTTSDASFGPITVYDFTMNSPGFSITRASGAGGGWTIRGNLRVSSGTIDFGSSSTPAIDSGNVVIDTMGTVKLSTAIGGDLNLAGNWKNFGTFVPNNRAVGFIGTKGQTLSGATTFDYLSVSDTLGLKLRNNITVNQTLTLTSGAITTGSSEVVIAPGGSVSRTSGYVAGTLQKNISASSETPTFEVGDTSAYAPVSLAFTNVTVPGSITVKTVSGAHPELASSDINTSKKVNRYWTVTDTGATFTSYNATFNWAWSDVDAGATFSHFGVRKYDAPTWSILQADSLTATSIQALGATSFSDFAVGEVPPDTIVATAGSNGSITPSGTVQVPKGSNQTFTILPDTGYHVDSVFVDGATITAETTYTFTSVTANHTIRAVFAINIYTITANAGANGSILPSGAVQKAYATSQTFTITPNTGYHTDSVFVDGVSVGVVPQYTFSHIQANHTIRTVYQINSYTITSSAGPHGTIAPLGIDTLTFGAGQSYTMTPDTGYHIDSVLVDSAFVGTTSPYVFSHDSTNHTIRVTFAIDTFTILATADTGGTVSPTDSVIVPYGGNQTIDIVPDLRHNIANVLVDGDSVGAVTSYEFTDVKANHTLYATFALKAGYNAVYRSFTYHDLIVKTAIKKQAVTDYWEFTVKNTSSQPITQFNAVFKTTPFTILDSAGLTVTVNKTTWTFGGTIAEGDSVVLKGMDTKPKAQQMTKLWLGPVTKIPTFTKVNPSKQYLELPMPNVASVRDYVYASGAFDSTGGLVVGIPRPDAASKYGWVVMKTSANMYSSLTDSRGDLHTDFENGFRFVHKQSSLPPSQDNDIIFADLLALKFNIAMSALGTSQPGFGELIYSEAGNPYSGLLLTQLAHVGDSLLTYHGFVNVAGAQRFDSVLEKINGAFSGPIDTISWGDSLKLTGVNSLINVPFLFSSGLAPAVIKRTTTPELADGQAADVPTTMKLYQNYPNPFNPTTVIQYDLSEPAIVTLKVYNMLGQVVATLLDHQQLEAGTKQLDFNASNYASGVYFYRIIAQGVPGENGTGRIYTDVKKMILVK